MRIDKIYYNSKSNLETAFIVFEDNRKMLSLYSDYDIIDFMNWVLGLSPSFTDEITKDVL